MDRPDEVGSDTSTRRETLRRRAPMSGPRIFAIAFICFFGAGAVWSAATPLLAAPDEPSQIVKAASVARGVWSARCYVRHSGGCIAGYPTALGFEQLPTFYDLLRAPALPGKESSSEICFKNKSAVRGSIPASCAETLNRAATVYDTTGGYNLYSNTYQARYPPLYYLVVGLPSYLGSSTIDLYLMRLLSAALTAVFLALSVTAALRYGRNRVIIAGLAVAITPMVLFLGAVVNPSGLEIASAIAVWTTGAILVTERLAHPPAGLVAMLGISAVVFESIRALSPFWLVVTVVALCACAQWRQLVTAVRTRAVQVAIGAVAVVGVLAVWWIVAVHSTYLFLGQNVGVPDTVSTAKIFETALERNRYYVPDMVGVFGWFDTYSPPFTFIIWYLLAAALIVAGAVRSLRRAIVLVALALATVVIPAIIVTSHARIDGYTWSGRDGMPIAVGLPILAAAFLGTGARPVRATTFRRWWPFVIALLAIAHFGAFYEAVRRYAVGTTGPIVGFLTHPSWQPAISNIGALLLEVAALGALSALYWWAGSRPVDADDTAETGAGLPIRNADGDGSSVSAANSLEGV